MSRWGTRRRNLIITIFLVTLFIILGTLAYILFYEEPTCFDGKRNGIETGIDCGGGCNLICSNEAIAPLVKWDRYFEVVPGLYNVVAYLENQNTTAGTEYLDYKFTLYDENGAIISEKYGTTKMRPRETLPIVENGLTTGKISPSRMTFEIIEEIVWKKEKAKESIIKIKDNQLFEVDNSPRVTAILENTGFDSVKDID